MKKLLLLIILLLLACKPQSYVQVGNKEYLVEIADEPEEWIQGLMYREALAENEGMLFIFDKPQKRSFWMKNTLIPLDIIYINSAHKVDSIHKNVQPCKESPCGIYPSNGEILYVLEVNPGSSIEAGDEVNFKI